MNIQETRLKLEKYYDIKDITAKGRKSDQITAKRYAIWYCKTNGFSSAKISSELNINIHTINYHVRCINDLISVNDRQTINEIYSLFKIEVSKDQSPQIKRVRYINKEFTPLLEGLTYAQLIYTKEYLKDYIISL